MDKSTQKEKKNALLIGQKVHEKHGGLLTI